MPLTRVPDRVSRLLYKYIGQPIFTPRSSQNLLGASELILHHSTIMTIFLVLVALLGAITLGEACSCMPSHPQEQFCRADFAIRAKVISDPEEELPEYLVPSGIPKAFLKKQVYLLRITKIYKGRQMMNATGGLQAYGSRGRSLTTKLYTPSKANSCSVTLTNGKVYVFAGSIYRKKLNIAFCHFTKEWSQITKKQRSGFARKFNRSCRCKIKSCYRINGCWKPIERMACALDFSDRVGSRCRRRHQYCKISSDGQSCVWNTNLQYRRCMDRIP